MVWGQKNFLGRQQYINTGKVMRHNHPGVRTMRILKTLCVAVGLVLALFAACDPARQR